MASTSLRSSVSASLLPSMSMQADQYVLVAVHDIPFVLWIAVLGRLARTRLIEGPDVHVAVSAT